MIPSPATQPVCAEGRAAAGVDIPDPQVVQVRQADKMPKPRVCDPCVREFETRQVVNKGLDQPGE